MSGAGEGDRPSRGDTGAEALRTLLGDELGAAPSPPIQALQLRLLKAADTSYTDR